MISHRFDGLATTFSLFPLLLARVSLSPTVLAGETRSAPPPAAEHPRPTVRRPKDITGGMFVVLAIVVVYFTGMRWRSYMPSAQALRAAFPSLEVEKPGTGLFSTHGERGRGPTRRRMTA